MSPSQRSHVDNLIEHAISTDATRGSCTCMIHLPTVEAARSRNRGIEQGGIMLRWPRRAAVLLAAALSLAATTLPAPAASAAVKPGCSVIVKTMHVNSGRVPVEFGGQRVTLQVCWNAAGAISSSMANQDFFVSAAGRAWSWEWGAFTAYPLGSATGQVMTTWVLP